RQFLWLERSVEFVEVAVRRGQRLRCPAFSVAWAGLHGCFHGHGLILVPGCGRRRPCMSPRRGLTSFATAVQLLPTGDPRRGKWPPRAGRFRAGCLLPPHAPVRRVNLHPEW